MFHQFYIYTYQFLEFQLKVEFLISIIVFIQQIKLMKKLKILKIDLKCNNVIQCVTRVVQLNFSSKKCIENF